MPPSSVICTTVADGLWEGMACASVSFMQKSTGETTGVDKAEVCRKALPTKVRQAHGGALNAGGTPGNQGGRPSSALRAVLRRSFHERIPILEEIADNPDSHPIDRIRAIETLGKFGLGQLRELSVETVREKVQRTLEVISESMPAEDAARIILRLRSVWVD